MLRKKGGPFPSASWWKKSWRSRFISSESHRGNYELVDNAGEREGVFAESHHGFNLRSSIAGESQNEDMAEGKGPARFANEPEAAMSTENIRSTNIYDGEEPTEIEKKTLRKVADNLPWSAFLIAIIELCERFTYYGVSGPFQNYISNSYNDPNGLPGAIGLGQAGATGLTNFFVFWSYFTSVIGAIVADQYLGKYWTIFYSSIVYICGILILFLTSLPTAIEHGAALGGLVIAMIFIGLGAGGIKSNVSPLIAEQYRNVKPFIKTLKGGEKVIVDPTVTIQRIYMVFYLCINVGSLSNLATTELEKNVGFWSAYLLPLFMFMVGFGMLIAGKENYIARPPKSSVIPHALKIMWISLRNKGNLDVAKSEYQEGLAGRRYNTPWDSLFVEEVRRALIACKVFLFYPIYWVVQGQMINNFISQAGQMRLHGIPNDLTHSLDPITIIVFIPICEFLFYPFLRKIGVAFKPITRIFCGFMLSAGGMAYAAGVQKLIYASGPCYTAPLNCDAGLLPDGTYAPNNVHVAIQIPSYLFISVSQIFASITGLEYAFTKAPTNMKSFIMSLFLLTNAFGAALSATLAPMAVDPELLWMYIGLAAACFVMGITFWFTFHKLNYTEESMNELDQYGNKATPANGLSYPRTPP